MIILKNRNLEAVIAEKGAQLESFKKDGVEYIWEADPKWWGRSAPILFPILCALKDNKYILEGKEYKMEKHGFSRDADYEVESVSDTSVTLLFKNNAETEAQYPFAFELRIIFTLSDEDLSVEYRVTNVNDRKMYFSMGAHEAYKTPEGVENYDIIFDMKENLDTYLLTPKGLLLKETLNVGESTNILPILEKYFDLDTLIFKNLNSKGLVLKNRNGGRAIRVDFPDFDYLGIWHFAGSPYLCIEPWGGLPDNDDTDYDFTKKEGIISLDAGKVYSNIHKITIL